MENYRRKYIKHYGDELRRIGIKFGNGYIIHHIDGDRNNNDIRNLLMLPRYLHSKYHAHKSKVENISMPLEIHGNRFNAYSMDIAEIKEFLEILEECNRWHDLKTRMDAEIERKAAEV